MYLHNVPTPLFLSLRCLPYSSWTEDTETCIFSEASVQQWRLAESSVPSELDLRIEQKFDEFDKLAAAGQKLIKERHHLADIVRSFTTGVTNIFCPVDHSLWKDWLIKLFYFKNGTSLVAQTPMTQPLEETENIWQLFLQIKERTEELQSMLGWILVYWRAQKDQLGRERSRDSRRSDAPQGDATRFSQGQPQVGYPCYPLKKV